MEHYQRPDWFTKHVFNRAVALATRLGISVWGSRVLRVRGRKSGEWRSSPVNLLTVGSTQYLVAPRGHTQWVRNIRVAGGGELVLGARAQPIKVVEVPEGERVPILREYLRRWAQAHRAGPPGFQDRSRGLISVLIAKLAWLGRAPPLDPVPLDLGLLARRGKRAHSLLDPGRELTRSLRALRRHRLADPDPDRSWHRQPPAARHDLEGSLDVHRHHRRPCLLREMAHAGLELLDPPVRRAAPLGEEHEVPARLQKLARAVQLALRATRAREREGVEEQADEVAEDRVLEPVVGRGGDHGAIASRVGQRVEDQGGVGVARVVGGEDHRALELAHPLPTLDLRVHHRLGERQQEGALDQVADRPYRLDARPTQVARRRGHDGALLRPRVRPRRVPVPAPAHPRNVADKTAGHGGESGQRAFRIPGQLFDRSLIFLPAAAASLGSLRAISTTSNCLFCQKP